MVPDRARRHGAGPGGGGRRLVPRWARGWPRSIRPLRPGLRVRCSRGPADRARAVPCRQACGVDRSSTSTRRDGAPCCLRGCMGPVAPVVLVPAGTAHAACLLSRGLDAGAEGTTASATVV